MRGEELVKRYRARIFTSADGIDEAAVGSYHADSAAALRSRLDAGETVDLGVVAVGRDGLHSVGGVIAWPDLDKIRPVQGMVEFTPRNGRRPPTVPFAELRVGTIAVDAMQDLMLAARDG